LKKNWWYVISFVFLVSFISFSFSSFKASAATNEEKIETELEEIAEKHDLEKVDPNLIPEDQRLNFDTPEEFEKFIQEQEKLTLEATPTNPNVISPLSSNTKTYSYTEYNGTGKIIAYARVHRTNSKVDSVKLWSEQVGFIFGITYTPNDTASYYKLNSTKKGGTAYVKGSKLYGANVGGQPVGYKKSVTYSVKF